LIVIFSAISSLALWLVYRYNTPRLSEPGFVSSASFYPTATLQLFAGLYFLELCLVGLFLLVRDSNDEPSCDNQAIIMGVLMVCTVALNLYLDYYQKRRNSISIKSPSSGASYIPERIYQSKNTVIDSKKQVSSLEYEHDSLAYQQLETVRAQRRIVWIPGDNFGAASHEITATRNFDENILISSYGAYMTDSGRLILQSSPPDCTE
jgi:hypothetical protein